MLKVFSSSLASLGGYRVTVAKIIDLGIRPF